MQKSANAKPEICSLPLYLCFRASPAASARPQTLNQGGRVPFLPMRTKTSGFTAQKCVFSGTFRAKKRKLSHEKSAICPSTEISGPQRLTHRDHTP